jgi:hypothetical protein
MISHYQPRRRPWRERLGLVADINDRLGWRLGIVEGDGLDVADAIIRDDMERWLDEINSDREINEMRRDIMDQIAEMRWSG